MKLFYLRNDIGLQKKAKFNQFRQNAYVSI